jgi:protein-tyrosine phosphatase
MRLDATHLAPHLYIGSVPPSAQAVTDAGFSTLVLCAAEIQPAPAAFARSPLRLLRCPLIDDRTVPLPRADWKLAWRTAERVARRVRRVLVTCAQGRNRSGLVAALAIHHLTTWDGRRCVEHVQALRRDALTNPEFVRALLRIQHPEPFTAAQL